MEERVQTYINGQTPIMAEALNAIQDAIIENSTLIGTQAEQISGKADASALTAETTAREAADTAEATARAAADTTLTNELDDVKSAFDAQLDNTIGISFESGGYSDGDGMTKVVRSSRIRNVEPIDVKQIKCIYIPKEYSTWVFYLNANKGLISVSGEWCFNVISPGMFPEGTRYINFVLRKNDDPSADITEDLSYVSEATKATSVIPFEINGRMNKIIFGPDNLTWIPNATINAYNGELINSGAGINFYSATDFFDVSAYRNIVVNFVLLPAGISGIVFYDENNKYINGIHTSSVTGAVTDEILDVQVQIPGNAKFCRFGTFSEKYGFVYISMDALLNQLSTAGIFNRTVFKGGIASGQGNYSSFPAIPANLETQMWSAFSSLNTLRKNNGFKTVPIYAMSDSHGNSIAPIPLINNSDDTIKCFHLGDIMTDKYSDVEIQQYYAIANGAKNICTIVGNHDVLYGTDRMYQYDLTRYFSSTNRQLGDDYSYFLVDDDQFRVRYICLDPFIISADGLSSTCVFNATQIKWLANSLMSSQYDVVIASHLQICDTDNIVDRSGNAIANSGPYATNNDAVQQIISAFQSKSNVSVTVDGETIAEDYSNTDHRILCTLSGHTHNEGTKFQFGIRHYVSANYMVSKNFMSAFLAIDRENGILRVLKFDNTQVFDEWDLPLFSAT